MARHPKRAPATTAIGRRLLRTSAAQSPLFDAEDVLISREPMLGMLLDDIEVVFDELHRNGPDGVRPLDLTHAGRGHRRWSARAVRHFLRESEGEGYWDFFKPTDHMTMSIADATYRTGRWVHVEGSAFFKLRLLLSGELRSERGTVIAQGPSALLSVSPGGASREVYFIAPGQPTHMVVLHCRREVLTDLLRLSPGDVPPPVNALFADGHPQGTRHRVPFGPDIAHATRRIIDSRYQLSRPLRAPCLEALSMEIVARVLGELASQDQLSRSNTNLSARDLQWVYEARDYLTQHFAQPPRIPELARLVGVNQTKLKAAFRQVIGKTIYEYILHCRMERACELLLTGDYRVTEVAYRVGYEYPANFTAAFKRMYGLLPKRWVKSRTGENQ
jgi:AraC family transcriptional regulator, transcriptional activator of the genes for pyochelin and ferripyochelin receptors